MKCINMCIDIFLGELAKAMPSMDHLLYNKLSPHNPQNIHQSLTDDTFTGRSIYIVSQSYLKSWFSWFSVAQYRRHLTMWLPQIYIQL